MVNEENDCHSHICEPLFSNHSKTMMLKTKVDIHVFSAVEFFFLDLLSLKTLFQTLNQMSQTSTKKFGVNQIKGALIYSSEGVKGHFSHSYKLNSNFEYFWNFCSDLIKICF